MNILFAMLLAATCDAVVFREDFSNYRDPAPGIVRTVELEVVNDPIYEPRSSIAGVVSKDTDIFVSPKALPDGNAFDVLCSFGLGKDATFEVVFTAANGKTLAVPFAGFGGWNKAAVTAKDGTLTQWIVQTNRYVALKSFAVPAALKTVNFRFKAGGRVELTDIVIRTSEPLPDTCALRHNPALAAVTQGLGPTACVSDGAPLDLADRSYSFVPGATGVVGQVVVAWDSGLEQKFPIAVGDEVFRSALPWGGYAQIGVKAKEMWRGPDAVIDFGSAAKLHVRPRLKNYANYTQICDAGLDLYRDWAKLPSASKHVTTVEVRGGGAGRASLPGCDGVGGGAGRASLPGNDGRATRPASPLQLWIDGSYAGDFMPPRGDKTAKSVVKVSLVLDKGVAYRVNVIDPDALQLWARPKAKAFANATVKGTVEGCAKPLDSADVGLAHYAFHRVGYECDTYMGRTPFENFLGEVHFRLPAAPYAQAEILFCLDDAADKVPLLKARMARYWRSDGVGSPEVAETVLDLTKGIPASVTKVGAVIRDGKDYPLYRTILDLPLGQCLDYASGDYIDLEFVGPTEENMQQDDRRLKPRADQSSAFNLFGVKLRKLNVVPELVQSAPGNIFTEDEETKTTAVKLTACVDGAKGVVKFGEKSVSYALAKAGDVVTNVFDFSDAKAGWYSVPMTIECGHAGRVTLPSSGREARPAPPPQGGLMLRHDLVYCVTPEAGRLATAEEAPYATWWFNGLGSPTEVTIGGPILQKAGIRKNSIRPLKPEENAKYGLTSEGFIYAPRERQFDPATGKFKGGKIKKDGKMVEVDGEEFVVAQMKAEIAKKPFVDHIMVWHESAPHCGIPEEILGLAAPTNDVAREKRLAAYLNEVGRVCRKHFPHLKIQIGNTNASIGAPVVPLRGGANPDYIDQIGMEIPSQTIPPERLFDFGFLGQNIAKVAAKKLSGRDIPSAGCYEFTYRPERDNGASGEETQARYHARDLLIALMNDYKLIAPGTLFDCRHSYCNSVYGQSGILHRSPYVYPKKAYQAYAVVTKVMDGVKFVREIPTGSTSVYAAEFRRKDGRLATAFWCARGEADLVCDMKGELWTMYGARSSVGGWFSDAEFACSGAPVYVISSKPCKSVKIVGRRFADDAKLAAQATERAAITAANVTVVPDPEIESTHHQFLPYLKPGVFTAKDVVDPEEGACLELTLDTSAQPRVPVTEFVTEYTTLRFKEPIVFAGRAALIGLRVRGNSNWAQVRFEIEDAKGEVFKGLSTGKSWGCDVYDWPAYTAISFDGWGDIYQYTDANDFDLITSPGPADEQWCSMTGGNKKIDWPVKLRAVTVGINRYRPTLLGFERTEMPSVRLKAAWAVKRP